MNDVNEVNDVDDVNGKVGARNPPASGNSAGWTRGGVEGEKLMKVKTSVKAGNGSVITSAG